MARSQPRPTDAELAILRVLWERGASTVRQVHEALADTRETGYTTTLKLMQIMADKGLVRRNETERTHVYSANAGEEQTQRQLVKDLADRAFGGSAAQLVLRALGAEGTTDAELKEIRKLIDDYPGETVMIDFAQYAAVDALAWTLLHFLWQGALLGLAAFFMLRLARPERASTRYAIGVATLGLMLIASATTFVMLSKQASSPVRDVAAAPVAATAAPLSASAGEIVNEVIHGQDKHAVIGTAPAAFATWRPAPLGPTATFVLVLAWGVGVLALSLRLLGGWLLTRSLTRHAISAVSPAIVAAARTIADRLQLRRAVAIVESGAVAVPTLVGWVKPVVLLPAAALSGLSPEQLQAILAHELAHVRRHDYLVNLLQSLVETLLFYHPAMWWVSAQVRTEREHCCDDLAVAVCGDRLVYATALAELTSITSHRAFALAATDGSLVGRVQRILGRPRSVHEPAPAWALLALLVLIVGSIGSFRAETTGPAPGAAPAVSHVIQSSVAVADPIVSASPAGAVEHLARVENNHELAPARQNAPPPPPPDPPAPPAPPAPPISETLEAPPAPPAPPAPAAHLAPLAPEAPLAPLAPLAPQEVGSKSSGNMSWSDGDEKIVVKWNGAFRLSDDEKDVEWMEDGARLTISDGVIFKSTVELRGVNGRIERTFSKNGMRRDYDSEGRAFLTTAIDRLIRHSGMFAKERVAKYLKRGGPEAVLAEIDKLGDSSYTHRIYYAELARQADLSESLLSRILQRVPSDVSSDYDKRTLFASILKEPAIAVAHRVQIATAVKTISSDYDQRLTLTAIMDVRPLPSAVAAAVLDATGSINSNYDRSLVLTAVAERGGLTPATSAAFMSLVRSMGSSYDQRRVLTAVTAQGALPEGVAADAIKTAGSISSSHDQSETLIKLIERGGLTDASADAFFQSAQQISSSYNLSRVLRRVVDQATMSDRVLEGVLRTAMRISGSHDRANLLEAVATRAKVQGPARQLYVDATKGMGSFDGNRALAALVRAER